MLSLSKHIHVLMYQTLKQDDWFDLDDLRHGQKLDGIVHDHLSIIVRVCECIYPYIPTWIMAGNLDLSV